MSEGTHRTLAEVHVEAPPRAGDGYVEVWPHLVFIELIALLVVSGGLWLLALLVDAPLEELADPSFTPPVAKAPWYFVGLQELLVYFDPWIAGVALPGLIILGLCAIPYLDRQPEPAGVYAPRRRPLAWAVFSFGLLLWFGLIAIGALFRGPHWGWYFPWESFETAKPPPPETWSLPWPAGLAALLLYGGGGLWLCRRMWPRLLVVLGRARWAIAMLLLLAMLAVPLKIVLRLVFDVRYVLETPWFAI